MTNQPYQVMPDLTAEEYEALKANIAEHGVMVPIEFDEDGNILDGHHRLRACQELGITDYPTVTREGMTEEEKLLHALTLNTARRHLTREQRAEAVAELIRRDPNLSDRKIAKAVGVTHPTVSKYRRQMEESGQVVKVTTRTGEDGKTYPSEAEHHGGTAYDGEPTEDPILKWQCCICKQHFPIMRYASGELSRRGMNNAWPLSMTGYCCDDCDEGLILPSRAMLLMTQEDEGEEAMKDLERRFLATDENPTFEYDADGMPDYVYPRMMAVFDAVEEHDASVRTRCVAVKAAARQVVETAQKADTLEAWEAARDVLNDGRRDFENLARLAEEKEIELGKA